MLYIDVGNTLRGPQDRHPAGGAFTRYELTREDPGSARLIVYDPGSERYFALADPELIRSALSGARLCQPHAAYCQ